MPRYRLFALGAAAIAGALLAHGCTATPGETGSGGSDPGAGAAGPTTGAGAGSVTSATSGGGEGGTLIIAGTGGAGGTGGIPANPCGSECGAVELCDPDHLGLDDNCDGLVDEACACAAGQAHFCFKGDPSYHGTPNCFDGTEKCTENGMWGPCIGGLHAVSPDNCFLVDTTGCHAITAAPFADVDLKPGTGIFSNDAVAGTEVWTVTCPVGVSSCPAVAGANPTDDFKPLQSGEYTVTYTKGLAGGGTDTCTYPLFVGAPGLRVELSWEHPLDDGGGVDLDLHVHQPNNTAPWGISPGVPQDCTWSNCVAFDFFPFPSFEAPHWFADPPAVPPTPVNWYLDPIPANNTCFFAPQGVGQEWQFAGQGCHNPRLDLDNITCDPTVSDPNDSSFCAPENINIDFPPANEWMRVGVHYYSNHGLAYDVHPVVKIFCNGALAADLGGAGFYVPEAPVNFFAAGGDGTGTGNIFWMVADVVFKQDQCSSSCIVQPIYGGPSGKTPVFQSDSDATSSFDPPYPPVP